MAGSFLFGRTIIFIGLRRVDALPGSFLCRAGSGRMKNKKAGTYPHLTTVRTFKTPGTREMWTKGTENAQNGAKMSKIMQKMHAQAAGLRRRKTII